MRKLGCAIVLLLLAAASPAGGQSGPGDADRGYRLARETCMRCHRIESGQRTPRLSPAISFQDIADNPARTALSLRVFLKTPHIEMPDIVLTEADIDDLISYIHGLK